MPTDSIKELIMKDAVTSLTGITTANGYANTIASVQRPKPGGNTFKLTPMLGVVAGPETKITFEEPWILKSFPLDVVIMLRLSTTETRSVDEILNSHSADVEKALTANANISRRGGYAYDTVFLEEGEYVPQEGQPEIGTALRFEITYRHRIGDPYSQ